MEIDWGIVVVSLAVTVPALAVILLYSWLNRKDKKSGSHFLGTQMDIAILIFGLLMLLAVIGWVKKTFFG